MEYERAIYRVYERCLEGLRDEENEAVNSKTCKIFEVLSLGGGTFFLFTLIYLHFNFVGRPGCLPQLLKERAASLNLTDYKLKHDQILQIYVDKKFAPMVDESGSDSLQAAEDPDERRKLWLRGSEHYPTDTASFRQSDSILYPYPASESKLPKPKKEQGSIQGMDMGLLLNRIRTSRHPLFDEIYPMLLGFWRSITAGDGDGGQPRYQQDIRSTSISTSSATGTTSISRSLTRTGTIRAGSSSHRVGTRSGTGDRAAGRGASEDLIRLRLSESSARFSNKVNIKKEEFVAKEEQGEEESGRDDQRTTTDSSIQDADTTVSDSTSSSNTNSTSEVSGTANTKMKLRHDFDFEFSTDVGLLTLDDDILINHKFELVNVTMSGTRCFGNTATQQLLPFGGIDTVVMNNIMYTLESSGTLVSSAGDYYSWGKRDIYPFNGVFSWIQFKLGVLFMSLVLFFYTSSVTALLVRILISSGVVLLFPVFWALQHVFGVQIVNARIISLSYPWIGIPMELLNASQMSSIPFIISHISRVVVYYTLYEAAQLAFSEWFYGQGRPSQRELWLFAIMMLWEYYSMIYVRSNFSIQFFPRASLALFLLYHFYIFGHPAGFHLLALLVLFLYLSALMIYCVRKYEIDAYSRGIVNHDQPRILYNFLPWPAWTVALAPDYSLFLPLQRRSNNVYQNIVPNAPGTLPPPALGVAGPPPAHLPYAGFGAAGGSGGGMAEAPLPYQAQAQAQANAQDQTSAMRGQDPMMRGGLTAADGGVELSSLRSGSSTRASGYARTPTNDLISESSSPSITDRTIMGMFRGLLERRSSSSVSDNNRTAPNMTTTSPSTTGAGISLTASPLPSAVNDHQGTGSRSTETGTRNPLQQSFRRMSGSNLLNPTASMTSMPTAQQQIRRSRSSSVEHKGDDNGDDGTEYLDFNVVGDSDDDVGEKKSSNLNFNEVQGTSSRSRAMRLGIGGGHRGYAPLNNNTADNTGSIDDGGANSSGTLLGTGVGHSIADGISGVIVGTVKRRPQQGGKYARLDGEETTNTRNAASKSTPVPGTMEEDSAGSDVTGQLMNR